MMRWFLIDSALSMSTGFGLNVLPNIVMAGICIVSGYLETEC